MRRILIKSMMILSIGILSLRCSNEELKIDTQQDYLDFILNEPYESQTVIIEEAAKRMDMFVQCKEGKFVISSFDYESLNISYDVYRYMLSLIEIQNAKLGSSENLHQIGEKRFATYSCIHSIPTLRTGGETFAGGIDDCIVEYTWHATYVHVYISNNTLRYSSYASMAAAIIASAAPEPIASKAVAAACGLTSLACTILKDEYPNGVVISIYVPIPFGPCIPYSLRSQ